jgi:RNA polymerase sigma-70 factor (ECF subfamily)
MLTAGSHHVSTASSCVIPRIAPPQAQGWRRKVAKDDSLAREPEGGSMTVGDGEAWVGHLRRIHEHGDHAAFAELFAHFAPRVKGFLMKAGADETTAEECAQDVMATLDMIRREKRPEPEALPWGPEEEPEPAERVALQQESERLVAALMRLPAKQRELVEKAYFGDLTHSEIAEATGLPLGTIKSRIRLALEKLRHEMKVGE